MINRKELLRVVKSLDRIFDKKEARTIKIVNEGSHLTLVAESYYKKLAITIDVPARNIGGESEIIVSTEQLMKALRGLREKEVSISITSDGLLMKGSDKSVELPSHGETPKLITPKGTPDYILKNIAYADMLASIDKTIYASKDSFDPRHDLYGICLDPMPQGIRFTATNAQRMHIYQSNILGLKSRKFFPLDACKVLRDFLNKDQSYLTVWFKDDWCFFATDLLEIGSQLGESLIKYENAIPKEHTFEAIINRAALLEAARFFKRASSGMYAGMILTFGNDKLIIKSDMSETVLSTEIDCDCSNEFKVRLSASYVKDALESMYTKTVVIEGTSEFNAIVIKPEGSDKEKAVIMPIKRITNGEN